MKFRVENTSRFIMINEINQDKEQLYWNICTQSEGGAVRKDNEPRGVNYDKRIVLSIQLTIISVYSVR